MRFFERFPTGSEVGVSWNRKHGIYLENGLFTRFESGALLLRLYGNNPGLRKNYRQYGVAVFSAADGSEIPPMVKPNGGRVPKNQLVRGYCFVCDYTCYEPRILRLTRVSDVADSPFQDEFSFDCYWPHEGAIPTVGGGGENGILLSRPLAYSPEDWEFCVETHEQCRAWCRLNDIQRGNVTIPLRETPAEIQVWRKCGGFGGFDDRERKTIGRGAKLVKARERFTVPYLLLADPKFYR